MVYKNEFPRIFLGIFLIASVGFLTACGKFGNKESDNSETITELQEQLNELQQSDNDNQTTNQIIELQQQITALQQNGINSQDPQITAQISALKDQLLVLQNKQTQIAELQKQVDELSKKTVDGSVILSCFCYRYDEYYQQTIETSGTTKAEALQDAKETCKKVQKKETAYVSGCRVKE